MALFEPIVQWLLYQEDSHAVPGKTVDLGDGAGFTRLGITSKNFSMYVPDNFFTTMPFRAAVQVAKSVYQEHYWDLFRGNGMQPDVAAVMLSSSVNIRGGVARAAKILQHVLGVTEDGLIGPKTLDELGPKDPKIVATMFRAEWENYYRNLVNVNPSEQRFLDGWLSRARFPYPSSKVPTGLYA